LASSERERTSEIKLERLLYKKLQRTSSIWFLLFYETLIGLKKFATLLQNIWLAKIPQPLAVRGLGIVGKGADF
jgi:hypothetical protein